MDLHLPADRFHILELSSQDQLKILDQDVRAGLLTAPRSLPPKYFYDDAGSKLFNAICNTKDYYPTRTEFALLEQHAKEIINTVQPRTCVELGAGASTKTEILLSKLNTGFYIAIDMCEEVLVKSAQRLLKTYPNLQIKSVVGEYIPAIQEIPSEDRPILFIFIGSSIGNFTEQESIELLSKVAHKMNSDDYFLLGLDRVKNKGVLQRAYDDTEGVTAQFNLNVLKVLNDKLGANFDCDQFFHQAIYNEKDEQIEMYLISKQTQEVEFPGLNKTIQLEENEKILTEISRKYTRSSIQRLLSKSGLIEHLHYAPDNEYFSLVLTKRGY